MDQKTIAIVSYITLVGWIIAFVSYGSSLDKGSLGRFHLRQAFGVMASGVAAYIALFITGIILPFLFFLFPIVGILVLIQAIIGLISAVNGEEKPIPVLGDFYQKTFTFIN